MRFIPEQRRGHWTAPGVETLLTLSCDKTSRAPILGVFFLFFPSSLSPLRTQTTPYVFLSLFDSFFLSLPFQTPEYTLFFFLSVSFVSFIIILVTSSSLSSSDNYIPPSLSISRLAHDTRLGSLPTLSLTREFPSCNIVYIIERIDEYAYLSHLICAQGRSRLPPSNLFSPFFLSFAEYTNY